MMSDKFSDVAAVLENVVLESSGEFSTDQAFEVINNLNVKQQVLPVTATVTSLNVLNLQSTTKIGKQPPFGSIDIREIKHFYQFALYENCVAIAVQGTSKPAHYQALAFIDVKTAIAFCEVLRVAKSDSIPFISSTNEVKQPLPPPPPAKQISQSWQQVTGGVDGSELHSESPTTSNRTDVRIVNGNRQLKGVSANIHRSTSKTKLPEFAKVRTENIKGQINTASIAINSESEDSQPSEKIFVLPKAQQRAKLGARLPDGIDIPNGATRCAICETVIQPEICESCVHELSRVHAAKKAKEENQRKKRKRQEQSVLEHHHVKRHEPQLQALRLSSGGIQENGTKCMHSGDKKSYEDLSAIILKARGMSISKPRRASNPPHAKIPRQNRHRSVETNLSTGWQNSSGPTIYTSPESQTRSFVATIPMHSVLRSNKKQTNRASIVRFSRPREKHHPIAGNQGTNGSRHQKAQNRRLIYAWRGNRQVPIWESNSETEGSSDYSSDDSDEGYRGYGREYVIHQKRL